MFCLIFSFNFIYFRYLFSVLVLLTNSDVWTINILINNSDCKIRHCQHASVYFYQPSLHNPNLGCSSTYVSVLETIFQNKYRKRTLKTPLYSAQRAHYVHLHDVMFRAVLDELWVVEVRTSAFFSFLQKLIAKCTIHTHCGTNKNFCLQLYKIYTDIYEKYKLSNNVTYLNIYWNIIFHSYFRLY